MAMGAKFSRAHGRYLKVHGFNSYLQTPVYVLDAVLAEIGRWTKEELAYQASVSRKKQASTVEVVLCGLQDGLSDDEIAARLAKAGVN